MGRSRQVRERKREQVWGLYRWEYSEKMHMLLKYMTIVLIVDDDVSALILSILSFSLFLFYKQICTTYLCKILHFA